MIISTIRKKKEKVGNKMKRVAIAIVHSNKTTSRCQVDKIKEPHTVSTLAQVKAFCEKHNAHFKMCRYCHTDVHHANA